MCDCRNFALTSISDLGQHHHIKCPEYGTEKFTYLFYYSDGFDAYIPASETTENVIDVMDFDVGEEREIKFKRVDMTDKEYDEMPDE